MLTFENKLWIVNDAIGNFQKLNIEISTEKNNQSWLK